jgi:hypothetical protein
VWLHEAITEARNRRHQAEAQDRDSQGLKGVQDHYVECHLWHDENMAQLGVMDSD